MVRDSDFDGGKGIEDVELGKVEVSVSVDRSGVSEENKVEVTAPTAAASSCAFSVSAKTPYKPATLEVCTELSTYRL